MRAQARQASLAPALPTGTVTFLFTDIEGSTRLWDDRPSAMRSAMARHDALIEAVVAEHGGTLVRPRGEGDSRFAVFAQASAAVAAATAIQLALAQEAWPLPRPLRVRIALHTGEADVRDGDYYGSAVNRCARLRALASGGQTVVSGTTAALAHGQLPARAALRDLGTHQLKDLAEPEHVFQLLHPELPDDVVSVRASPRARSLPNQPTPFVQRTAELRVLDESLRRPDVRLLTLVGPGGIGKTRLALAVAEQMAGVFADGLWFVDLSAIGDPMLVCPTIAHALGIPIAGRRSPLEHVQDYLRDCHALLVLDNFEQVLEAAAEIARLLAECPDVKVLTTSREPLRLRWEHIAPVRPLAVPGVGATDLAVLAEVPAVAFFVQRAQAADPDFGLTADNAGAVAELCARLDGLPLALELAAARVRTLAPAALLPLLDRAADLLRGTADAPGRQQSLRATVEWSYALLPADEQRLFRCLGVFAGGCTTESARAVCQEPGQADVLLGLAALVDKNLVRDERDADGGARFRLLETIRPVALEKLQLAAGDEAVHVQQRHAEHFLSLAETAEREAWGPDAGSWVDRLEREHDNVRAALTWLLTARCFDQAQTMVVALEPLWLIRRHLSEGQRWLQAVIAAPEARETAHTSPARALALALLALITQMLGDPAAASRWAQDALLEARRYGDPVQLCRVLWLRGELARARGDHAAARSALEEALELSRSAALRTSEGLILGVLARLALDAGKHREGRARSLEALTVLEQAGSLRGLERVLQLLGTVALASGDVPEGRRLFEQSVAICRGLGDRWLLIGCLAYLGYALVMQGEFDRARALFTESVELSRGQRDAINAVRYLLGFAHLAAAEGQPKRAVRLAGAADGLRRVTGLGLSESVNSSIQRWLGPARAALGAAAAQVWASGERLSVEEATAYALSADDTSGAGAKLLSDREREVAALLAQGFSNRRIAHQLVISERTAEAHVAHILAKLGLDSRLQIAVWAAEHGLAIGGTTDADPQGRA